MLISDLAPILRLRAREAPNLLLERMIRESAREFFRESRVWRLDFVGAITPNNDAYDLNLPVGTLAYDIEYAKLRTLNKNLAYIRDAAKKYVEYEDLATAGSPSYVQMYDDNTFRLYPPPSKDDVIEMRVILSIVRDAGTATEIDDQIVEEFEDVILDGALARLYEMPGETWSNIKQSQFHRMKFLDGTERARLRGQETRTPGTRVANFSW